MPDNAEGQNPPPNPPQPGAQPGAAQPPSLEQRLAEAEKRAQEMQAALQLRDQAVNQLMLKNQQLMGAPGGQQNPPPQREMVLDPETGLMVPKKKSAKTRIREAKEAMRAE